MKKRHGGPGCFPISCELGLGAVWVEPIEGERADEVGDECRHLIVRVPSYPDDIESKPRDYILVLGPEGRKELVRQLTDATPEGA